MRIGLPEMRSCNTRRPVKRSPAKLLQRLLESCLFQQLSYRNRTRGVQATVLRAEEQLGAGARGLGFCRWLPSKPQLSSPT
ncbi:MAG: hypothetical protein AB7G75_29485, partial [Candidatus Binatia bacterium]